MNQINEAFYLSLKNLILDKFYTLFFILMHFMSFYFKLKNIQIWILNIE